MSIESSWYPDQKEESSGEEDKDSRRPKKWLKPPIMPPATSSQEGTIEWRQRSAELPRPPVFEEMVRGNTEKDKDEDEEDNDEGDENQSSPVAKPHEADALLTSPETTVVGNEAGKENVGHTIEDAGAQSIDQQKAAVSQEFEEIMQQMDPEYAEAPYGEMLAEPLSYENMEAPEKQPETDDILGSKPTPQSYSTITPPPPASPPIAGGAPPRPPVEPPVESRSFEYPEDPDPAPIQNSHAVMPNHSGASTINYNAAPSSVITAEQHRAEINDTEYVAERRGLRRGLVAGFITGYVVKAYLANRKSERYEKATKQELNRQNEQITNLQQERQRLSEQMAARFEWPPKSQVATERTMPNVNHPPLERLEKPAPKPAVESLPLIKVPEEQIFDREGNEIVLQPGWRVERSAGGYSVVLDEHNRVVHDAIHYGEAYKHDQKREQLSADVFAISSPATPISGTPSVTPPPMPAIGSGQADSHHQLETGQPASVDVQHRLPKPRNQVVVAAASPWLWTAVAVLVIVYFIAALA